MPGRYRSSVHVGSRKAPGCSIISEGIEGIGSCSSRVGETTMESKGQANKEEKLFFSHFFLKKIWAISRRCCPHLRWLFSPWVTSNTFPQKMPTGWPVQDHSSLRLSFQVILDCVKLPVQTKHPNRKRIPRYFQIKQTCNLITLEVQIRSQPDLHSEFQASQMTLCLKKSVITLKKYTYQYIVGKRNDIQMCWYV